MEEVQGEYIDESLCVCIDHDHDQNLESDAPRVWQRRDDESTLWYDRFVIYLLLPPGKRNILEAYRHYEIANGRQVSPETIDYAPSNWYDISKQDDWEARATAYDDHQRDKLFADEEALREKVRRECIEGMRQAFEIATQGIASKSIESVGNEPLASLSLTQKNSLRELERLLNLSNVGQPIHNQLTIIINQLPADVQKAIAKLLPSLNST